MKGHLDVKELEKCKKADLQKLAKELGVSTEGTIKELAERCAEVEVEIPDESELTEEEKEEEAQLEKEAQEAWEAAVNRGGAEENKREEPEKDDEPQAAGTVTVEVTAMYLDKVLNEVKEPGEVFTVSRERATILERAKVAKIKE